jgi:hypothetical protein
MDRNDFLKGFQEDPKYQNDHQRRHEAIAKRKEQLKVEEAEFIAAWRSHGFPEIEFLDEIKGLKERLSVEQVNFILKWIPKVEDTFGSQEFLVRALILASKSFDGRILMELFDDPNSSFNLKWAIGNTMASVKVLNITDWLISKFKSLSLGKEKEMLVYALGEYLEPDEARHYLVKLFDNYPIHVADTLAKIGCPEDLKFLMDKLSIYNGPGRSAVKNAIRRLEKKLNR